MNTRRYNYQSADKMKYLPPWREVKKTDCDLEIIMLKQHLYKGIMLTKNDL